MTQTSDPSSWLEIVFFFILITALGQAHSLKITFTIIQKRWTKLLRFYVSSFDLLTHHCNLILLYGQRTQLKPVGIRRSEMYSMWKGFNPLGGHFVWRRKPVITESSHRICQGLPGGLTAGTPIKMTGGQSFFHLFFSAREQAEHWVPLVILLFYGYTVLKSWMFSIVNHWVLHRHCDRLRKFFDTFFCDLLWTIWAFWRTLSDLNS